MKQDIFVSVVAPLDHSAFSLRGFCREVTALLEANYSHYELILVDEASTDATQTVAAELLHELSCIRYIRLTRKVGQELAIYAGLEQSIGDFTVIMVPETDPPSIVPAAVKACQEQKSIIFGESDLPYAETVLSKFLSRCFHYICNRYLELDLPGRATQFRVVPRVVVLAIVKIRDRYPFLRIYGSTVGFSSKAFSYTPRALGGKGRAGMNLWKRIDYGIEIIIANSKSPLRTISRFCLFMGALCLIATLGLGALEWATGVHLPRGFLMEVQISLGIFLVLLVLMLISEYLGRVLEEAQSRPLYYILYEKQSSVMLTDNRVNVVNPGQT
jgi:glycosyltransferase involved in cell wall biosynthesis